MQRRAFTVVELMIVLIIISILIAILLPAINSVRGRVKEVRSAHELHILESRLTRFQAEMGKAPPSRIRLYTTKDGWKSDPRSFAIVKGMWPQFDIEAAPEKYAWSSPATLTGAECLVFFLGGVPDPSGIPVGFSKSPKYPFSPRVSLQDERLRFHRFDQEYQLSDKDGDGFQEFCGFYTSSHPPIIYASSYGGRGYDARDLVVYSNDWNSPTPDDMTDIYRTYKAGMPGSQQPPYNGGFWQLIAAGRDGQYGLGGMYDMEVQPSAIVQNDPSIAPQDKADFSKRREFERDNVTNFHAGSLWD